ncbi:CRISPR-associated helicase Cas3' [Virgibacillus kimchii]
MVKIAHVREKDNEIQTVSYHLLGVKKLSETFGAKLGLKHVAGLAGLLHDVGKYTDTFQKYINDVAFYPETTEMKRGDVDHSTAGGKLLFSWFHNKENTPYEKLLAEIVGNAIISHHSNLHDYISPEIQSDYLRRVRDKELKEYENAVDCFFQEVMDEKDFNQYVSNAVNELQQFMDMSPTQSFFLTKYIFSCLIDADRTDTRWFEENTIDVQDFQHDKLFALYYEKLISKLESFKKNSKGNEQINILRQQMSEQCDLYADKPSGIYTLSIPTGGGKTLASLRYSLKHAQKFNKQRIIYVVPFTTIIEQNAQEVRNILEDEDHILEHHSNVIDEDEENDEQSDGLITKKEKIKLARDNWDSPIIFTTMVQFLNIFYAKGNRNTRRLHNLSHSVLVFDEVQKVPTKCVSLFNEALNFLKKDAYCSILLCTATQPTLENVNHFLLKERDGEIVQNLSDVSKAFKRVDIIDRTERPTNNDELAEWVNSNAEAWGSTLVILNTKSVVKELYEKLKDSSLPVYHLSTGMCAAHRKDILSEVRRLLHDKVPFICITTQLIEAGVDVSFKCVIRSSAGLDSIAQAAGRCNRHGENDVQDVHVIDHADENLSKLKEIKTGKEISGNVLVRYKKKGEEYDRSLLSQIAMDEYFRHYYQKMETDLNYYIPQVDKEMTKLLMATRKENDYVNTYKKKHNTELPLYLTGSYKTAANHFQVIDQITTAIIVPYGKGKEIIAQLNSVERVDDLSTQLKKAQQYTVNVHSKELTKLKQNNAIISHLEGTIYELRENWYSGEYGIDLLGEGEMGSLIM